MFDMTDEVSARATRENWLAMGRRTFSPSMLALVAASTAIFALSLRRPSSVLWLVLAGAAPVLLLVMAAIFGAGFWWYPRMAQKKLVRLPHRQVTILLADDELTIATANERFELKWITARELRELPHFFVLVLASGSEIPLPREAVSAEAKDWLQAKLTSR